MFDSPMMSAFLTLTMAVVAIGVIFYILKKYSKKITPKLGNKDINIISRSSLTPKSHLYTVEVDGEKLLLGVTETNVNLIKELKSPEPNHSNYNSEIPEILNQKSEDISFKSFLKKAVLNK
jgi:flagellar protein FliO/FliZ